MSKITQAILSMLSSIRISYISMHKSELNLALMKCLKPYINKIIENPENIEIIVEKFLRDEKAIPLLFYTFQEVIMKVTLEELTEKDLAEIFKYEKFKKAEIKDALEIILEHDLWKLKQIKNNFDKYAITLYNFSINYPEDAHKYVITLLSIILLLLALNEVTTHDKLKIIEDKLNKLSDELESYTLTFMLMLEERKEENKITTIVKNSKELKEVLDIE
ncbi:MAG: hypothetical protein EF809_04700 [Candidatus Methanomethylicota archaeon]|uniref:Uncharacterized protein n=2 Tax=Thermoproteota archaeon TaxID=2056631 RepID=A0A520KEX2_9CREN|nr:MAG: hypothetical protein EF809_04700 [Candidatus Verstraetearchaeota archaeon]